MVKVKKRLLYSILLVLFSIGALPFLAGISLKLYLESLIGKTGYELSYSRYSISYTKLTYYDLTLSKDTQTIPLKAEALALSYGFDPFDFKLLTSIEWEQPELTLLHDQVGALEELAKQVAQSSAPLIPIDGKLKIENGTIHLHKGAEKISYHGSMEHHFGASTHGSYSFAASPSDSSLTIGFDQDLITIEAGATDASLLGSLIFPFCQDFSTLQFAEGTLDGSMKITLKDAYPHSVEGELLLRNGLLTDRKNGNRLELGEVRMSGSNERHLLHIALSKGGALIRDRISPAKLHGLKGSFVLTPHLDFHSSLEGFLNASEENSYLFARATGDLPNLSKTSLQISLHHSANKKSLSSVELTAKDLRKDAAVVNIELKNIRDREFLFAQNVLNSTFPTINPIEFSSGTVTGNFHLEFSKGTLQRLEAKSLDADHLLFLVKPLEVMGGAQKIRGRFGFSISEDLEVSGVEAELEIHDGEALLTSVGSDLWHFNAIETALVIKHGIVQKSSASIRLAGLAGQAEILEGSGPEFLRFHFEGTGRDLRPFLPERMQKGLEQTLLDDKVLLIASVGKAPDGAKIEGEMRIKSLAGYDSPPIAFGFSINKLDSFLQDTAALMDKKERFFKEVSPQLLQDLTPAVISSLANLQHTFLLKETGFSSFTLRNGWIKADQLQLEKFVGPFLFPENEMRLSGVANLEASFDLSGINLMYSAQNVQLQNAALSIDVPQIGADPAMLPAFHRFDFITGKNFGYLPIEEGSYFDKESGLLFAGIYSKVFFEGEKVHVDSIESFSGGLFFAGNVDVDYSPPGKGVFNVDIALDAIEGRFSQLQAFYKHFDKEALVSELPLESRVSLGKRKGRLLFSVQPDDFELQASFECSVEEGTIDCPNVELAMKELSFTFYYDHTAGSLEINDTQGIVLVGQKDHLTEFSMRVPTLQFSDFEEGISVFDAELLDDNESILKLAGKSVKNEGWTDVRFDLDATHFLGIHPQEIDLKLIGWDRLESFNLSFSFRLSTLLHELQRFSRCGLLCLSKELLAQANHWGSASGEFQVRLGFDGADSKLNFDIAANDLNIEQHHFKKASLNGYKRDKRWLIDQLKLDDISASAELLKDEQLWKVDFLGIQLGEGFLVGLDGIYMQGDPVIRARMNLLEVDLEKMTSWMSQYPFLESFQPYGSIKGTGEISFESSLQKGWIVDAIVDTSFKDLSWKDLSLKDSEHISLHFKSDKGITLRNLKTTLSKLDKQGSGIQIDAKQAQYDFTSQSLQLNDIAFNIAASHLPIVAAEIESQLSSPQLTDLIAHAKKNGSLSGSIEAAIQPGSLNLQLKLADGVYTLWDDERTLSQFTLNLEDEEARISTQYKLNDEFIWVAFRLHPDHMDSGEIVLADTHTEGDESLPLSIRWKNDPKAGLVLEKIQGSLSGLYFDLAENLSHPTTAEAFSLYGKIDIDGGRAKKIAPPLQRSALETLLIGKGYTAQGAFEIAKEVSSSGDRDVRFFGSLAGNEVELKGYRFRNLSSQIMLEPSSFQMLDLTLSDPAGTLHIGNVSGKKNSAGLWDLSIPLASAYDFRPSFLREVDKADPANRKPLIIRQLFVQDIQGTLGNASSFTGHGNLHFDNPQKKNLQNTLFAIPAEILTRIGLNLSVLTPINGTIHYEIQNEKIYLTKFKDVYSNRKISKFYLASGAPSTIDFDGNLDIQVRFKQSTLLLKLVEMFMINVSGTLEKPAYSLQRQKYLMKEDLYISTKEGESHAP